MKRWAWLALAWVGVVCVLFSLCFQVVVRGWNHPACIACGDRSVGSWRGPARAAQSPELSQARAGLLEDLAIHFVRLTDCDIGPPWLDTRGPPGLCRRPGSTGRLSAQADSSKQQKSAPTPGNPYAPTFLTKRKGFCNSL